MARQLTLKQRAFCEEYVANGGNGTQAALMTYDTDIDNTANAIASENLSKPMISTYVEQLFHDSRIDTKNRTTILASIMHGIDKDIVTSEQLGADGKVVELKTTRPVSHTSKLKAIDLANRMDGTYSRNEVAVHAGKRMADDAHKAFKRRLSKARGEGAKRDAHE